MRIAPGTAGLVSDTHMGKMKSIAKLVVRAILFATYYYSLVDDKMVELKVRT
jgi:hypothetical protein